MLRTLAIFAFLTGTAYAQVDLLEASTLSKEALALQQQGRPAEAVVIYTRALKLREKQLGPHHPDVAAALNNLGVALRLDARPNEAGPVFLQSLAIAEECGDNHLLATVLGGLGATLVDLGQFDRAEPVLRRSLAMFEQASGPASVEAAEAGNNLAMLYRRNGHLARAQEQMEHVLPLLEQRLGSRDPEFAKALNGMFVILAEQNQWDQAEPYVRRALAIGQQVFPDSIQMAEFRENLALVAAHRHEFQAAASLLGDAITAKERLLGAKDPQLADSLENYSAYLKQINQKAEAKHAADRARDIRKTLR